MKEHVLCLYIQVCAEHHRCHGTQCGGHVRLDRNMQTGQRKRQGDSPYKAIQTSWKIRCGGRQTGAVNLICFAATQVPWERTGKQLPYQARGSHKASRRKREMEDRASGSKRPEDMVAVRLVSRVRGCFQDQHVFRKLSVHPGKKTG